MNDSLRSGAPTPQADQAEQPDHPAAITTPSLTRREGLARLGALWASAALPLGACGGSDQGDTPAPVAPSPGSSGGGGGSGGTPTPPPPPPPAPPPPAAGPLQTAVLTSSLANPWGLAFLPDGRMLVTQKGTDSQSASMVVVSADGRSISTPLAGVPAVVSSGQGGLLDVVLDPDFATPGSNWVYFAYSEAGTGGSGTAVNRGRLDLSNLQLLDVTATPIFRQLPKVSGSGHFGCRLAFATDKTLFIALGERQQGAPAQDMNQLLGKVVRINRDGSVPTSNPFYDGSDINFRRNWIWSLGHRNPQGAAIHPSTGELWVVEHGPQGGDELNRVLAGRNFGWPNVSYGCNYGATNAGCEIGGGIHAPTYTEPVSRWPEPGVPTPYSSIAPSGLMFYTGSGFPEWQGHAFLGALAGTALWRVQINSSGAEVGRERLLGSLGQRIRCVRQGPDGWIYLLTDSGQLIRVYR